MNIRLKLIIKNLTLSYGYEFNSKKSIHLNIRTKTKNNIV